MFYSGSCCSIEKNSISNRWSMKMILPHFYKKIYTLRSANQTSLILLLLSSICQLAFCYIKLILAFLFYLFIQQFIRNFVFAAVNFYYFCLHICIHIYKSSKFYLALELSKILTFGLTTKKIFIFLPFGTISKHHSHVQRKRWRKANRSKYT